MLKDKVKCLAIKVEVAKEKAKIRVEQAKVTVAKAIAKAEDMINSFKVCDKLKNNFRRIVTGLGTSLIYVATFTPLTVFAYSGEDIGSLGDKIKRVFNPIIELLASLGYPTAYIMLVVGGLMIMSGRKAKGLEVIKWASIGYVALQFIPFLLDILDTIGRTLRGGI